MLALLTSLSKNSREATALIFWPYDFIDFRLFHLAFFKDKVIMDISGPY